MSKNYHKDVIKFCEKAKKPPFKSIDKYLDKIDWINFSKHPKTDEILKRYKDYVIWYEITFWIRLTPGNIKEFFPYLPRLSSLNVEKIPREMLLTMDFTGMYGTCKDMFGKITEEEIRKYPELLKKYPRIIDIDLIPENILYHCPHLLTLFLENWRDVSLGTLRNLAYMNVIDSRDIDYILTKHNRSKEIIVTLWDALSWTDVKRARDSMSSRTNHTYAFIAELLDSHLRLISRGKIAKEVLETPVGCDVMNTMKINKHLMYDICTPTGWNMLSAGHKFAKEDLLKYYGKINWTKLLESNEESRSEGLRVYIGKNLGKTLGESALKDIKMKKFA